MVAKWLTRGIIDPFSRCFAGAKPQKRARPECLSGISYVIRIRTNQNRMTVAFRNR
jgi:hypothetical protein